MVSQSIEGQYIIMKMRIPRNPSLKIVYTFFLKNPCGQLSPTVILLRGGLLDFGFDPEPFPSLTWWGKDVILSVVFSSFRDAGGKDEL